MVRVDVPDATKQVIVLAEETPVAEPVITEEIPDIPEGTWWDTDSQRCRMAVEKISYDSYSIVVEWANSAAETCVWEMTAHYDAGEGTFRYADGVSSIHTYADDGGESVRTMYTDGTGAIQCDGKQLYWTDDQEHVRDDCAFEME